MAWQTVLDAAGTQPLPRQYSPTIFTSPVIAVGAAAAAPYWQNQAIGYVNQEIETELIGLGFARSSGKKVVFSNELTIINFPFDANYRLSVDLFARLATTVTLSIYEYTGDIT
ncbi:hypothetical protein QUA56_08065 [Microcoleus sp. N3A4]|uniref:hypothetical protein n=1 Tax=Microcoleus sp. N3A4 TaxID=3055379 RepID=UPI002FCF5C29